MNETVLLNTHNICFDWNIRKIILGWSVVCGYGILVKHTCFYVHAYLNPRSVHFIYCLFCNIPTQRLYVLKYLLKNGKDNYCRANQE